jgi:hypothetical protein
MDLAYRFDEKTPRPTIRLSDEDIFRLAADGLHGLNAMAELFEGRRSYSDLSSNSYRADIEDRTEHSMILRSLRTVRNYAVDGRFPNEILQVGELLHDVFAFGYSQMRSFDFMTEFYGIPTGTKLEPLRILLSTFIARWKYLLTQIVAMTTSATGLFRSQRTQKRSPWVRLHYLQT